MIAEVIATFLELLTKLVEAKDDKAKQEAALMTAEERLARSRALKKFGG
jgi:hypothetical protein